MECILQRIKSNNIYIFGAGAVSDMVYDYLKAYDLSDRILAFLVTELGDNAIQKHGLKVINNHIFIFGAIRDKGNSYF